MGGVGIGGSSRVVVGEPSSLQPPVTVTKTSTILTSHLTRIESVVIDLTTTKSPHSPLHYNELALASH
jgi:hypothetical protein